MPLAVIHLQPVAFLGMSFDDTCETENKSESIFTSTRTMHVAMGQFFQRCFPDVNDFTTEVHIYTRQWMVKIHQY